MSQAQGSAATPRRVAGLLAAALAGVGLLLTACASAAQPTPAATSSPTPASSLGAPTAGTTPGGTVVAGAVAQTVTLHQQNRSGVSGTATLTDLGNGRTRVVIHTTGPVGTYPAHIHAGTCANLDPTPKYPLENVENGTSTTDIPVSLAQLHASPTAINLHQSLSNLETYVACGDITSSGG